jgi:condensin complex subunit 3
LTSEKALLARVCVEHCITTNDRAKLEVFLPVVTHLAFRIQGVYNKYQEDFHAIVQEWALRALDANERDVDERLNDLLLDAEFLIAEMLKLAVNLDYADEVGRRKMFQLVQDMIGQEGLPDGKVARCLDVLRVLSPSGRDLIRVVVEVVPELRDEAQEGEEGGGGKVAEEGGEDDASPSAIAVAKAPKPPEELTPEEQARADALDLRCLSLCIGMLERVNSVRLYLFPRNGHFNGCPGCPDL